MTMNYAVGTRRLVVLAKKAGILWAFIGLCIVLAILSPAFITPNNLMNVIKQISVNGILGIAMTFVLILGGIDLSVGSLIALTGVCAAFFAQRATGHTPPVRCRMHSPHPWQRSLHTPCSSVTPRKVVLIAGSTSIFGYFSATYWMPAPHAIETMTS